MKQEAKNHLWVCALVIFNNVCRLIKIHYWSFTILKNIGDLHFTILINFRLKWMIKITFLLEKTNQSNFCYRNKSIQSVKSNYKSRKQPKKQISKNKQGQSWLKLNSNNRNNSQLSSMSLKYKLKQLHHKKRVIINIFRSFNLSA
jgi:hypothetical protein